MVNLQTMKEIEDSAGVMNSVELRRFLADIESLLSGPRGEGLDSQKRQMLRFTRSIIATELSGRGVSKGSL
jgi:hypothetical protein